MPNANYRRNIPKILILNSAMMFLVIMPIIVPYWQSKGLSLAEIYQLQAVFGGVMIALDVPAGYLADIWGRKSCLLIVGVLYGLSFSLLAWAESFWGFVGYEVLTAIALSLYSGCDIALMYDSIEADLSSPSARWSTPQLPGFLRADGGNDRRSRRRICRHLFSRPSGTGECDYRLDSFFHRPQPG
jgi:MFS family permease